MSSPFDKTMLTLYQKVGEDGFARPGMCAARSLVGADLIACVQLDQLSESMSAVSNHTTTSELMLDVAAHVLHEDIRLFWDRAKPGRACIIDDYTSHDEFRRKTVHKRFLEGLGIAHLVVLTVNRIGGQLTAIVLGRCRREFDGEEVDRLQQLQGYLVEAQRLCRRIESGEGGALRGLEWRECKRIRVSPSGVMIECSSGAERWLRKFWDPGEICRPTCHPPADILNAIRNPKRPFQPVATSPRGTQRLFWTLSFDRSGNAVVWLERRSRVSQRGLRFVISDRARKQVQILEALLAYPHDDVRTIAKRLNMNEGTVKGHVNSICNRLGAKGVHRRAILADKVSELLLENYDDVCAAEGWGTA